MADKIKLILWDVDGTLLDFLAAEKAGIKRCFEIFGLGECTDEMVADYSLINKKYWEMLERGEMTKPQILIGRFTEFFRRYSLDESVAPAFNEEYQIRLGDTIVFFPHASETVKALKGRVIQCAVTNGTKRAQARKLENSGLGALFDHVFISEEVGAEKPDVRFFDEIFRTVGSFGKNEILIVGDSLTSDIQGGNNAGIKTCFFNPYKKAYSSPLRIDYEISSLDEVIKIADGGKNDEA